MLLIVGRHPGGREQAVGTADQFNSLAETSEAKIVEAKERGEGVWITIRSPSLPL